MEFSPVFSFLWGILCGGIRGFRLFVSIFCALHLRGPYMLVHFQQMALVRVTVPFPEMLHFASGLSTGLPLLRDNAWSASAARQQPAVTDNIYEEDYRRRIYIPRRLSGATNLQLQSTSATVESASQPSARKPNQVHEGKVIYEQLPEAENRAQVKRQARHPSVLKVNVIRRRKGSPSLRSKHLGELNLDKSHKRVWKNTKKETRPKTEPYDPNQDKLLETSPVTKMRPNDMNTYRWGRTSREEDEAEQYHWKRREVAQDFAAAGEPGALYYRGSQLAAAKRPSRAIFHLILTHVAIAFAACFGAAAYRIASESEELKETIAAMAEQNRAAQEEVKVQREEQLETLKPRQEDSQQKEEKPQREIQSAGIDVSSVKEGFLKLPTAVKQFISGHLVLFVISRILPLWLSIIPAYLVISNYSSLEKLTDMKLTELAFKGAWKIPRMASKFVDSLEDAEKTAKKVIKTLAGLVIGSYLLSPMVISLMLLITATASEYKQKLIEESHQEGGKKETR